MDTAEHHRHLADPAWRRLLLLSALALICVSYIAAFGLFVTNSRDFIVVRNNQRALEFARSRVVSPPAKLSFGVGESENARLGGGWHAPDTGGVWSQATDSFVEIVVPHSRSALLLRVRATVFVAGPRPRMSVRAFINGVPAGNWQRDSSNASEPIDVRIPEAAADSGQLEILLKLDHVASPLRLNSGPDDRQLGLLLHSIELSEAPDATRH